MVNVLESTEESAMDQLLYIIKSHLPKLAVAALPRDIGNVANVKSITDMRAFIIIEFYNKVDAEAAKAKGFELTIDGQTQKFNFETLGIVQMFMNNHTSDKYATGY